jgi:hypothetical protein
MLRTNFFYSTYKKTGADYPKDGLISRYTFDDSLNDTYGSNNGWTSLATPAEWAYETGKINQAFATKATSNATNTKKTIRNNSNINIYKIGEGYNTFSISLWFKVTNASQDHAYIFSTNSTTTFGNLFLMGGPSWKPGSVDGGLWFETFSGKRIHSAVDYRDNQWHHAVATYDDSFQRFYVDNVERGTALSRSSRGSVGTTTNAQIGADLYGSWPLNGLVDLLYFYNRALTTDEISQLYNNGDGV